MNALAYGSVPGQPPSSALQALQASLLLKGARVFRVGSVHLPGELPGASMPHARSRGCYGRIHAIRKVARALRAWPAHEAVTEGHISACTWPRGQEASPAARMYVYLFRMLCVLTLRV